MIRFEETKQEEKHFAIITCIVYVILSKNFFYFCFVF